MKNKLTLSGYVVLVFLISGVGWLISGTVELFHMELAGELTRIVSSVLMIVSIVTATTKPRDCFDEMGTAHMNEAKDTAITGIIAYFAALLLLSGARDLFFSEFILTIDSVAPWGLAVISLTISIKFILLEGRNSSNADAEDENS